MTHRDLPDHAQSFLGGRSLIFLAADKKAPPMPWSMINSAPPKGRIRQRLLPLNQYKAADRRRNRRLYGVDSIDLFPTMLVMHFTVIPKAEDVMKIFLRPSDLIVGNQDPERSLVSVHYMVDVDGTVMQLAREDRITSGTYGVDHLALAIEMVAKDEADLKSRPIQLLAAFHLADTLTKRHNIPPWRVFSHEEVAFGKFFMADYTDLADTEYPYFYPKDSFRYDPGTDVMAWCREFLFRQRGLWEQHPASR